MTLAAPSNFRLFLTELSSSSSLEKEAPLHYLIASQSASSLIVSKLRELKSQNQLDETLRKKMTEYEVTPLHLAVMVGDKEVVQVLLDRSPPLDTQDCNRCTPLHLAATCNNRDLLKRLSDSADKVNAATRKMKNCFFATADEILQSMSIPEPSPMPVAFYKNESGEIVEMTSNKFKELTQASYCPYAIVAPDFHANRWLKREHPPEDYAVEWEKKYRDFQNQPSCIYLEREATLGLGVRARTNIPPFSVFDVYGGSYIGFEGSVYSLDKIEALNYATVITRGNDHVPNTLIIPGYVNGASLPFAISIKEIRLGEKVHYNYELSHSCKWGKYIYTQDPDFETLASTADYMEIFNAVIRIDIQRKKGSPPTFEEYLQPIRDIQFVYYILDTPRVLAEFLLRRVISPETLNKLLHFATTSRPDYTQNNPRIKRLLVLLTSVARIVNDLEKQPEKQRNEIRQFFLGLLEKHRIILALQCLETYAADPAAIKYWKQYCELMQKKLIILEDILMLAPDLKKTEPTARAQILHTLQENRRFMNQELLKDLLEACEFSIDSQTAQNLKHLLQSPGCTFLT